MQKSFYLLFLCLLAIKSPAQSTPSERALINFVPERILLHTDRQLYSSGEVIWFKVLVFEADENQLSGFSQVAYLELLSREGLAVSRVKVALENGRGNGTIELPQQLNSGNYSLRAYTQGMRNGNEAAFGQSDLRILNPVQAIVRANTDQVVPGNEITESPTSGMAVSSDRYLDIQVQASKTTFGQRSLATLEITTTDANGQAVAADLSLSVALTSGMESPDLLFEKSASGQHATALSIPTTIEYAAEDRGMQMDGVVINDATQAGAPGVEVYLAFPGERALVYLTLTDEAGRFSFLLPKLYGLRQVVLQARSETALPLRIELTDEFHRLPVAATEPFVLPEKWLPQANAILINAQVQQSYQSFELPPVYQTTNPFDSISFYGSSDARYVLDDYNRFPLPEFFFEIVLEVLVKGKYGDERVAVLNDWSIPYNLLDPLLLVDGVPVFDQRTFLKINNKLIESSEIVTEPFWLNPRIFNGVIELHSFEKDGRCFRLPEDALQRSFLTLLPERQFSTPDHTAQADSRLPDFRNTLYWNPSITTDVTGKATISFSTSDVVGDYEIRVEGVSLDGYAGSSVGTMRVVKEMN